MDRSKDAAIVAIRIAAPAQFGQTCASRSNGQHINSAQNSHRDRLRRARQCRGKPGYRYRRNVGSQVGAGAERERSRAPNATTSTRTRRFETSTSVIDEW